MRAYMARLTSKQLDALRTGLDNAFYWFDQDAVLSFLSRLGHSDEKIGAEVVSLLQKRNEMD
jgi:hypothetical protein